MHDGERAAMATPQLDVTRCAGATPVPNVAKCLPLASVELTVEPPVGSLVDGLQLAPTASAESLALMVEALRSAGAGTPTLGTTPRSGPLLAEAADAAPSALRAQVTSALAAPTSAQLSTSQAGASSSAAPASTPPSAGASLIGTPVRKVFAGYGEYDGCVRAALGGGTFEVEWSDGDVTKVKASELQRIRTDVVQPPQLTPIRAAGHGKRSVFAAPAPAVPASARASPRAAVGGPVTTGSAADDVSGGSGPASSALPSSPAPPPSRQASARGARARAPQSPGADSAAGSGACAGSVSLGASTAKTPMMAAGRAAAARAAAEKLSALAESEGATNAIAHELRRIRSAQPAGTPLAGNAPAAAATANGGGDRAASAGGVGGDGAGAQPAEGEGALAMVGEAALSRLAGLLRSRASALLSLDLPAAAASAAGAEGARALREAVKAAEAAAAALCALLDLAALASCEAAAGGGAAVRVGALWDEESETLATDCLRRLLGRGGALASAWPPAAGGAGGGAPTPAGAGSGKKGSGGAAGGATVPAAALGSLWNRCAEVLCSLRALVLSTGLTDSARASLAHLAVRTACAPVGAPALQLAAVGACVELYARYDHGRDGVWEELITELARPPAAGRAPPRSHPAGSLARPRPSAANAAASAAAAAATGALGGGASGACATGGASLASAGGTAASAATARRACIGMGTALALRLLQAGAALPASDSAEPPFPYRTQVAARARALVGALLARCHGRAPDAASAGERAPHDGAELRASLDRFIEDLLVAAPSAELPAAALCLAHAATLLAHRAAASGSGGGAAESAVRAHCLDLLASIGAAACAELRLHREAPLRFPPPKLEYDEAAGPNSAGEDSACVCGRGYDKAADSRRSSEAFMLDCDLCHRWFHGVCVGVHPQRDGSVPALWYCDSCLISAAVREQRQRTRAAALALAEAAGGAGGGGGGRKGRGGGGGALGAGADEGAEGEGGSACAEEEQAVQQTLLCNFLQDLDVGAQRGSGLALAGRAPADAESDGGLDARSAGRCLLAGWHADAAAAGRMHACALLRAQWAAFAPPSHAAGVGGAQQVDAQTAALAAMLWPARARDAPRLSLDGVRRAARALGAAASAGTLSRCAAYALDATLRCVSDAQPAFRARALKALAALIEADPQLLARPAVQGAVEARLTDAAVSVREAAVELLGKHLLATDDLELATRGYRLVATRLRDVGISVRKRVVRILRELATARLAASAGGAGGAGGAGAPGATAASLPEPTAGEGAGATATAPDALVLEICALLAGALAPLTDEEGLRSLILSALHRVMLEAPRHAATALAAAGGADGSADGTCANGGLQLERSAAPSPRGGRSASPSAAGAASGWALCVELIGSVAERVGAETWLPLLLGAGPTAAGPAADEGSVAAALCSQLVDAFLAASAAFHAADKPEPPASPASSARLCALACCLRALSTARPELLAPRISSLQRQLGPEQPLAVLQAICATLTHTLPLLRKPAPSLVRALETQLGALVFTQGAAQLPAAVEALCAVAHCEPALGAGGADSVGGGARLLCDVYDRFWGFLSERRQQQGAPVDEQSAIGVMRAVFALGLLCRFHDFDAPAPAEAEAAGAGALPPAPACVPRGKANEEALRCLFWWAKHPRLDISLHALRALGFLWVRRPAYLLHCQQLITSALGAQLDPRIKVQALRNFAELLAADETAALRREQATAMRAGAAAGGGGAPTPAAAAAASAAAAKVSASDEGGICSGALQAYLPRVCELAADESGPVQAAAVSVLAGALRAGVAHPHRCLPPLLALEGASAALSPAVRAEAARAVASACAIHPALVTARFADALQLAFRLHERATSGAVDLAAASSEGAPPFGRAYAALPGPQRKELLGALLAGFGGKAPVDAPTLRFLAWCALAAARLPIGREDEALHVAVAAERTVGLRAGALADALRMQLELAEAAAPAGAAGGAGDMPVPPAGAPAAAEARADGEEGPAEARSRLALLANDGAALVILARLRAHFKAAYNLSAAKLRAYAAHAPDSSRALAERATAARAELDLSSVVLLPSGGLSASQPVPPAAPPPGARAGKQPAAGGRGRGAHGRGRGRGRASEGADAGDAEAESAPDALIELCRRQHAQLLECVDDDDGDFQLAMAMDEEEGDGPAAAALVGGAKRARGTPASNGGCAKAKAAKIARRMPASGKRGAGAGKAAKKGGRGSKRKARDSSDEEEESEEEEDDDEFP